MDRELGLLMRRLRRTGLFDQALLVVVADHGYAFEVGRPGRRLVTETNIDEIAGVPFFVKAPGQTEGEVDDEPGAQHRRRPDDRRPARHAGLVAPRRLLRLLAQPTRAREQVAMSPRDFSRVIGSAATSSTRARAPSALRWARAQVRHRAREPRCCSATRGRAAYRVGPHPELLGRAGGGKAVARRAGRRARWQTRRCSRTSTRPRRSCRPG